jgi:hypothetical protein
MVYNTDRLAMTKRAASVDDQRTPKRVRITKGESQYLDNIAILPFISLSLQHRDLSGGAVTQNG